MSIGGAGTCPDLAAPARWYSEAFERSRSHPVGRFERHAVVEHRYVRTRGGRSKERLAFETSLERVAAEIERDFAQRSAEPGPASRRGEDAPAFFCFTSRGGLSEHEHQVRHGIGRKEDLVAAGRQVDVVAPPSRAGSTSRCSDLGDVEVAEVRSADPDPRRAAPALSRATNSTLPVGCTWRSRVPVEVPR